MDLRVNSAEQKRKSQNCSRQALTWRFASYHIHLQLDAINPNNYLGMAIINKASKILGYVT